jgi:pyruvate ferredoxin oxidoreductase beta subunit
MEDMENAMELSKNTFSGSSACHGCGAMIGLKLALQVIDNCILVNSTGCISLTGKYVKVPFVHAGLNAAAVARGISSSLEQKAKNEKEISVLVYAGDGATRMNLQSLLSTKEDIIYICYNNYGFSSIGYTGIEKPLAKQLAFAANYVATSSVAFPDDFIKKLQKSKTKDGLKFIELLAPCPIEWGFDTSNTIEISRLAVETGFWPLYEIEDNTLNLTKRPIRLEPVERYFELLKGFKLTNEQIQPLQVKINKDWKLLTEGKIM